MSDQTDEINHVEKPIEVRRTHWVVIGIFFSAIVLIILFCAFGFGYFKLAKTHVSLVTVVSDLQGQIVKNQSDMETLQKTVASLEQAAQKSQQLSQQQEQIMMDWQAAQKGNLDKWYIAEAQYLVKLANDHLQFTHNLALAKTLLLRALKVLENLQDPQLLEIRKSLTADLANAQAISQVDITALYMQLVAINQQMDQLPLPINPLKEEVKQTPQTLPSSGLPWWKVGLDRTLEALSKVVIVRYNTSQALPLVMPEEKAFLYQNVHAQMENAIWAVLHQNASVYQTSLARAMTWIQIYFDQGAQITSIQLQNLQALIKVNVAPATINLANSLLLFDNYFAKAEPAN